MRSDNRCRHSPERALEVVLIRDSFLPSMVARLYRRYQLWHQNDSKSSLICCKSAHEGLTFPVRQWDNAIIEYPILEIVLHHANPEADHLMWDSSSIHLPLFQTIRQHRPTGFWDNPLSQMLLAQPNIGLS